MVGGDWGNLKKSRKAAAVDSRVNMTHLSACKYELTVEENEKMRPPCIAGVAAPKFIFFIFYSGGILQGVLTIVGKLECQTSAPRVGVPMVGRNRRHDERTHAVTESAPV